MKKYNIGVLMEGTEILDTDCFQESIEEESKLAAARCAFDFLIENGCNEKDVRYISVREKREWDEDPDEWENFIENDFFSH